MGRWGLSRICVVCHCFRPIAHLPNFCNFVLSSQLSSVNLLALFFFSRIVFDYFSFFIVFLCKIQNHNATSIQTITNQ